MKSRLSMILCTFLLAPCVAVAETYFSLSALAVMPATQEVRGTNQGTLDLTAKTGFGMTFAYGAMHDDGTMTELEFGFHNTETRDFEGSGRGGGGLACLASNPGICRSSIPAFGHVRVNSLMVNHYGTFGEGGMQPYLGAGLGIALFRVEAETSDGILEQWDGIYDALYDDDVTFAWQAMAGLTYQEFFRVGYRYFATADAEINGFEFAYGTHAVEFGIRF